ncbi:MAG: DMT family transporter [Parvularculaceae bacterium]|nr:DMT family transporter [Parvularculaceae bacterium]
MAGPFDWMLLAGLSMLGGSAFVFIHSALESVPPAIVSIGRLWIAAIALYAAMRAKGRRFPPLLVRTKSGLRPHRLWAWMSVVGVVGYTIPFFIFPWAQQFVPSGLAGVYMAFMPIWTLGLAFLFASEALTPARIAGFGLAAVGVLVLLGPEAIAGAGASRVAAQASLLLATLLYAVSAVISRRAPPARRLVFSAGIVLAGAVFATPALFITPIEPERWSAASVASIVALGLGPTAIGSLALILLIRRVGASFMALANYVTPLFAVAAGAALYGERLGLNVFIALVLIFGGVAISQRRAKAAPDVIAAAALQKSS